MVNLNAVMYIQHSLKYVSQYAHAGICISNQKNETTNSVEKKD